jgi:hypothetical protein
MEHFRAFTREEALIIESAPTPFRQFADSTAAMCWRLGRRAT